MLIRSKRSHEGTKGHAIDSQRLEDAEGSYQLSGCPGVLQCGPAKVLRANEGGRCRAISWHGFPPLVGVHSSQALYAEALHLQVKSGMSWHDSLIVSAAIQAQCDFLYTEDLQHGQRFGSLQISNPFL